MNSGAHEGYATPARRMRLSTPYSTEPDGPRWRLRPGPDGRHDRCEATLALAFLGRLGAGVGLALWVIALFGCEPSDEGGGGAAQSAVASAVPEQSARPWPSASTAPPVPRGMVWIPPGALIAGTAPERLPRKADSEMPGEQVVLEGYFIDRFAYPNEQGAIPETKVTQAEARSLCEAQDKRLCSELEWERACKGPDNTTYEYGDAYSAARCGTGTATRPLPSGHRFSCVSGFGVADMHGGLFEWTDSPWGRGSTGRDVVVRGGNGPDGEVVGRCANAARRDPNDEAREVGFRCCAGARNRAEVALRVTSGLPLRRLTPIDSGLSGALERALPETLHAELRKRGRARVLRLWEWRPVVNEEVLAAGVCAGAAPQRLCGVLLVRRTLGRLDVLDWAPSGLYVPTVKLVHNPRMLWIYGGDRRSHFRRHVEFEWGRVKVGAPERGAP